MKLKYYLRGLGIGMLVTALILTLSGNADAGISDDAVRKRAAELGMVEKDKTVLGELGSEAAKPQDDAEASGVTVQPEDSAIKPEEPSKPGEAFESAEESSSGNNLSEPEKEAETQSGAAGTDKITAQQELAESIEKKAEEVADRAEEVAENSPAGRVVKLEVRRGDSSVSVARRAAEAGLVQSAADFDVFLCRNGYDKRISVGTYEITEGMTEKEIADIITKSR